ncbi:MAG: SWIM zinc finger family protein, partial [Candidatus Brocadiae bacterium]|nr:SWIM zinc finger family protein [Candidatus Brocadiia bacterium]
MEITREKLQTLTDSGSWDRGIGYFEQGRVLRLMIDRGTVVARIMGTHEYEVTLWADEDDLHGRCTCPMGDAGVFCKHCVATGLECLDKGITELSAEGQPSEGTAPGEKEMDDAITDMKDIRKYLRTEDTEALVEMIVAQAKADGGLLRRLAARAALSGGEGLDIEAYRQAISEATSSVGFVDYADAFGFASALDEVVDEIGGLLEGGHADEVVQLSEYAMGEVEGALDHVDDSGGWMGDILYRLQELHHEACTAAKPDPRELAGRLFRREVTSDYDVFSGAAETYADVLGEEGLAEYRRLAEGRREELTPLKPGHKGSYESPRYRLTRITESLAEASGDLDELVAIKSRDLSKAWDFLEIAEIYRKASKFNKAMQWAERGLKAFPGQPNPRLRELLANEYHRRRRHDEGMELIWPTF